MPEPPRRRRPPGTDLASAVVDRRLALGLTQADLADLAGVSRRSITALESGKSTVRMDVLLGVIDALGAALLMLPAGTAQEIADREAGTVVAFDSGGSHGDAAG